MVDTPAVATELTMAMTRLRARLRRESSAPVRNRKLVAALDAAPDRQARAHDAAALAQIEHVRPQSIAETVAALKADDLVTTASVRPRWLPRPVGEHQPTALRPLSSHILVISAAAMLTAATASGSSLVPCAATAVA